MLLRTSGAPTFTDHHYVGNTIVNNRADSTGHNLLASGELFNPFYDYGIDTLRITNSILWDEDPEFNEVLQVQDAGDTARVVLRNCYVGTAWWDSSNGNILTDEQPGFVAPQPCSSEVEGDYGLDNWAQSPCIDAGRSAVGATDRDRYGNARYDDETITNTGSGAVDYVDIGAIEHTANSGTSIEIGATYSMEVERTGQAPAEMMYCRPKSERIARWEAAGLNHVHRTFVDFATTQIPDDAVVDSVAVRFAVYEGFDSGYTMLQVRAMGQPGEDASNCTALFNTISSQTVYHESNGWDLAHGVSRTIDLGADAVQDLQDQLGDQGTADGWFSIGLRLKLEDYSDGMAIYGQHTLIVKFHEE
ncbi:hypothetical protein K8I85_03985 [bacterium]|nr:hypothetical protein [bacterium]